MKGSDTGPKRNFMHKFVNPDEKGSDTKRFRIIVGGWG